MRVEIPFVVLNKKGRPVEGADIVVYRRDDYDAEGNVYGLSSASSSGTTYTYVTNYVQDLAVGDHVTITGCSVSAYNVTDAVITGTPTTSSFTLTGATGNPDIPEIFNGRIVKTPLSPAPLYETSDPEDFTEIVLPQTDAYGRIEGWLDEDQYVITVTGLNLDAVQYFEAVAGNVNTGTFTRAGVTLTTDSVKIGNNTMFSADGADIIFPGNSATTGYSSTFNAFPFSISSPYYSDNLNRDKLMLGIQASDDGLGYAWPSMAALTSSSGPIVINPYQTKIVDSASAALNVVTNVYDYTYTTSTDHNLTVGTPVVISGASNDSYNGEFTINAVTANTFTAPGSVANPGSTSFSSGEAATSGQAYKIYGSVVESQTIAGGSSTAISSGADTITNVTTSTAPYVGQGIQITNGATTVIDWNTTTIKAISGSNPYTLTLSTAALAAASGTGISIELSPGFAFENVVNSSTTVFSGTSGDTYITGSTSNFAGLTKGMGVSGTSIPAGTKITTFVEHVAITGGSGTFTLTYDGQTTASIAYNASISTVQTALLNLSNLYPGDVTVTGSASSYDIELPTQGKLTGTGSGGATATITITTANLSKALTGNISSAVLTIGNVFTITNEENVAVIENRATLPTFSDSSSTTIASIFGTKNKSIGSTFSDPDVEAIRTVLNGLIEDLKKYGLIS